MTIQRVSLATASWAGSHACGEEGKGSVSQDPRETGLGEAGNQSWNKMPWLMQRKNRRPSILLYYAARSMLFV